MDYPNPLKKTQNPQKTLMEILQLCNFCNFGATLLEFRTMITNIILLWIQNFGKNWTTLTPYKYLKTPQNTSNEYEFIDSSWLYNYSMVWARGLGLGILLTILLLWIRNFSGNRTTLIPLNYAPPPLSWINSLCPSSSAHLDFIDYITHLWPKPQNGQNHTSNHQIFLGPPPVVCSCIIVK